MRRLTLTPLCGLLIAGLTAAAPKGAAAADDKKPDPAALARTRKTVHTLDDVYKTTIVMITDKYVKDKQSYPAGRAAILMFRDISGHGSHEVRLIDVSGEPDNARNIAKDDFEKKGVEQLKAGKDYYEQVVYKEGKPYLRAMTAVPVVMDKCILCHENYKKAKKGEAVGAL